MRAVASVPRAWKLDRAEKPMRRTPRPDGATVGGGTRQIGWVALAGRMQGWSGLIETMGRTINLAPQKQDKAIHLNC